MTDLAALRESHRLLTALMVERAGGPRVEGSIDSRIPGDAQTAARELPLIGCFIDEDAGALVVDLDETEQAGASDHRQALQRLLGDRPFLLRYGRNEDQNLDPRRSEP